MLWLLILLWLCLRWYLYWMSYNRGSHEVCLSLRRNIWVWEGNDLSVWKSEQTSALSLFTCSACATDPCAALYHFSTTYIHLFIWTGSGLRRNTPRTCRSSRRSRWRRRRKGTSPSVGGKQWQTWNNTPSFLLKNSESHAVTFRQI